MCVLFFTLVIIKWVTPASPKLTDREKTETLVTNINVAADIVDLVEYSNNVAISDSFGYIDPIYGKFS